MHSTPRFRPYQIGLLILPLIGLVLRLPVKPVGLVHSMTDNQGAQSYASGVYIGNGIVLTNWHVLKTLHSRQEYFKLPLWNEHIYNFELPVEWIIFSEKSIDLAIGKLPPSGLDRLNVHRDCLSLDPIAAGEVLTITSSPLGRYPPTTAHVTVINPIAEPRLDLDPQVREEKRYAAISFSAIVHPGEEDRIESGSSGGAVTNAAGNLVGLLWARYNLMDGSKEVLITPVSAWLPRLESADIAEKYKKYIIEQVCK